jgi:hypothetical protein
MVPKNIKNISVIILAGLIMLCKSTTPTETNNKGLQLEEIEDVLPNPLKGFAPWIGTGTPVYEEKLQYATFAWKDLEPLKGVYDWSFLEKNWGNISISRKRVGFRVAAAIPGSGEIHTPQWLIDEGIAMRPYSIDGHDGFAPDWDDPRFLGAHHDFILALGNRYDTDPRVVWIDIGSYGFWGEWHVWLNESLAASQATKQAILEDYFQAFPSKLKVIAFDDDFATWYVTDRGGGIRNDCLGTADANNWYLESLNRIDPSMNDRIWTTAVITGEFCGADLGAIQGTTERFDLNYDFVKQTHWSFIGPAGGAIFPRDEQHRENLDRLVKTLGYRFVIRRAEHASPVSQNSSLTLKITVENLGVAPFYLSWPLVLYLIGPDSTVSLEQTLDVDIRQWLPGIHTETVEIDIPGDLSPQTYEVKLAIPDPDFGGRGILFANTRKDEKDRYLVSHLKIQ